MFIFFLISFSEIFKTALGLICCKFNFLVSLMVSEILVRIWITLYTEIYWILTTLLIWNFQYFLLKFGQTYINISRKVHCLNYALELRNPWNVPIFDSYQEIQSTLKAIKNTNILPRASSLWQDRKNPRFYRCELLIHVSKWRLSALSLGAFTHVPNWTSMSQLELNKQIRFVLGVVLSLTSL